MLAQYALDSGGGDTMRPGDLAQAVAYAPFAPYKFMALEIVLVPVSGDVRLPDWRLVVGGTLLVLFLTVGWVLAAVGKP